MRKPRLTRRQFLATRAAGSAPVSDRLCEETVGFHQRLLLGTRDDMDDIASAVVERHESRVRLAG